mgnify:FL=1
MYVKKTPNLIKSDFSDFTAYAGATFTRNKTFPIEVFKGGRNLIPNSGVTKQFTEQIPKPQINSDFDLKQILTLKCYFKIQLGDLI